MLRPLLRVAVILGSTRPGSFATTAGEWFAALARERGDLSVDLIDLADVTLPTTMPAFGEAPPSEVADVLAGLTPRLAAADAFVVVTTEYNHSFPAGLENAIDWHRYEWQAKPVSFVSYGGISGGLRAVEALRLVFAELHAVTMRDTGSFQHSWRQFDDAGNPVDPDGCTQAAKTMLDRLTWWAHALREARAASPYAR